MVRFGVDLGGTKIEIVALDADGAVRLRRRVPSPAHDYGAIVNTIGELVASAETELGTRGTVGVGTPGARSRATGLMKNANSTVLIGKPLQRDLEARLGRPIRLANDANCFALSEARDGAGAGARTVFGTILGTGVGGGIVVDGAVLEGPNAVAGEWGHTPLPWPRDDDAPAPPCYCGKSGCLETYLSGPGLARDYGRRANRIADARAIATRARAGEAAAQAALERYADRLARGLAVVVNVLDPDVVVLGGGVSNVAELFARLDALLPRYVFSDAVSTRVTSARHGDSSGVRGAAWLWDEAGSSAG